MFLILYYLLKTNCKSRSIKALWQLLIETQDNQSKGKGDKKTNQNVINAEDPANKAAVDKIFELAD